MYGIKNSRMNRIERNGVNRVVHDGVNGINDGCRVHKNSLEYCSPTKLYHSSKTQNQLDDVPDYAVAWVGGFIFDRRARTCFNSS